MKKRQLTSPAILNGSEQESPKRVKTEGMTKVKITDGLRQFLEKEDIDRIKL